MTDEKHLILKQRYYYDYYDHHFSSIYFAPENTPVWHRNSRDFPNRTECFNKLKEYGIPTPVWGIVRDMANSDKLVVYTDELSHQGFGKELLSAEDALEKYPDHLCSQYIYSEAFYKARVAAGGKPYGGISRRYLMIGEFGWVLEYRAESDWRSNVGNVDIDVLGPLSDWPLVDKMIGMMREYKSPIFALDVVPVSEAEWLCTDLNLAPGMAGCGINELVPAVQAAEQIKDFYYKYCL